MTRSPTGGDWRRRKRDETHERIYAAAMRLFTEHGFEQVSVAQIATAASVSVPTFYAHYAGKEDILLPLPEGAAIAEVVTRQPAGLPLPDRIRGAVLTWFGQLPDEEVPHLLARWQVVAATPSLRIRCAEYERATAALVLAALTPDPREGSVRADAVVVTAYLAVVTAVFLAWAAEDGRRPLDELAEEAFETLRRA